MPSLKSIIFLKESPKKSILSYDEIVESGKNQLKNDLFNSIKLQVHADDAANIQFTSGTTGKPKGATLSHFNITNNAKFTGSRMGYNEDTVICCPPPLYHCFGCVIGTLCSVIHGASIVFPSETFRAKAALQSVHAEKCTSIYGTPTMFIDMLANRCFKKYDLGSLRTGIMAGSICAPELCQKVIKDMKVEKLTIVYGTTENSPVTFQSTLHLDVQQRINTVGHVHDHIEAKVVDEKNKVVPVDHTGELLIRGYCVMLNYWNDEAKTDEVISRDKWYKTGDLATMDRHGRLKIVGRKRDMVIRGGENIYPAEIEEFLHHHPKILDVQVIGVPDKRLGEELCAWIRLKDTNETLTVEEIRHFCEGKIAYFKIPKYIVFKEANDFPLTVTGKIQKYKMREIATKELNLD